MQFNLHKQRTKIKHMCLQQVRFVQGVHENQDHQQHRGHQLYRPYQGVRGVQQAPKEETTT